MEIIGKVKVICDLVQGETAAGPWCRRDIVVTKSGDDGVDICVSYLGQRYVDKLRHVKVGDLVQVFGTIKSRQNGERWYTSVEGNGISVLRSEPVQVEMQMLSPTADTSF